MEKCIELYGHPIIVGMKTLLVACNESLAPSRVRKIEIDMQLFEERGVEYRNVMHHTVGQTDPACAVHGWAVLFRIWEQQALKKSQQIFSTVFIMANLDKFKEVFQLLFDEIREDLSQRGVPSLTNNHLQQVCLKIL